MREREPQFSEEILPYDFVQHGDDMDEVAQILDLLNAGHNIMQIARTMKMSRLYIKRIIDDYGN